MLTGTIVLLLSVTSEQCSKVPAESYGYAVLRVKDNRGSKNYIAKFIDGPYSDNDYEVYFMKRC